MKHLTLVSRSPAPAQANAAIGAVLGLIASIVNVFAVQVVAKEAVVQQQDDNKVVIPIPPVTEG